MVQPNLCGSAIFVIHQIWLQNHFNHLVYKNKIEMGIVGNKIKIRKPLYNPPCNADEGVYCTVGNQTFILL